MANETTLEAALDKIAADNNLTSVTVGRMLSHGTVYYTATVHWAGFARSGNACESDHTETGIRDALAKAIAKANADRLPLDALVDALPTMEAA